MPDTSERIEDDTRVRPGTFVHGCLGRGSTGVLERLDGPPPDFVNGKVPGVDGSGHSEHFQGHADSMLLGILNHV